MRKRNHFTFIKVVGNHNNPSKVAGWVQNKWPFHIGIGDTVVFGELGNMFTGTVIRRSNIHPGTNNSLKYEVIATTNQFPVESNNQPELCNCTPVVPEGIRLQLTFPQDRIDDAKGYLKNALEQLEKI